MKIRKINTKKLILLSLGVSAIAIPAIALSSCSAVYTNTAKVIDLNYATKTYSSLQDSKISLESAIYGSNYNKGNYIFLYGTTGAKSVRDFLYGPNGNAGSGTNATIEEQNFSTSSFFQNFFDYSGLGNGLLPYNLPILSYIDLQPYDENYQVVEPDDPGKNGLTPFAKWTEAQVLQQYNDGADIYDVKTLPDEAKFKIGTYRRYDQSAIRYREIIDYLLVVRPNVTGISGDNKNGGLICFREGFDPKSFDLSASSMASIEEFYTSKKPN